MKMSLLCQGYTIRREIDAFVSLNVDFILAVHPKDSVLVSEALKKIEIMLSEQIDLVKADLGKPRCFYCGTLNDAQNNTCTQCGGPL